MTIYQTRLDNLRRVIGTQRGHIAAFAARMDMRIQQASHVVGSKPVKHIGDTMARRIEQVYGLPVGSLDIAPESRAAPANAVEVPLLTLVSGVPVESEAFAHRITLDREWLRRNMAVAPEHAALACMSGDTMAPTLLDGDILLVDRGATRIEASGIYAIGRGEELHILRVQRSLAGGFTLSCDNRAYPPYDAPNLQQAGLLVLGRVLMNLRPSRV